MCRLHTMLIALLVLALSLALGGLVGHSYAEKSDANTGVVLSEGGGRTERQLITCTLTIFPTTVTNSQRFVFAVSYEPCLEIGTWTETFLFNWPSTLTTFEETTVRQKIFRDFLGCVIQSGEAALTPDALGINGTFTATVRVTGEVEEICEASAEMTVE